MIFKGSMRRCCPACVNCQACESDERFSRERSNAGGKFIMVLLMVHIVAIILAVLRHYGVLP